MHPSHVSSTGYRGLLARLFADFQAWDASSTLPCGSQQNRVQAAMKVGKRERRGDGGFTQKRSSRARCTKWEE